MSASCGNCSAWKAPPRLSDEQAAKAARSGVADRPGHCRAHPAVVQKAADDWCREHAPTKEAADAR